MWEGFVPLANAFSILSCLYKRQISSSRSKIISLGR
jgi:hypothetical protein